MPVLPTPTNDGSQQILDQARSQATQSLRGTLPDSMLAPPGEGMGHVRVGINTGSEIPPGEPLPEAPDQTAEPMQEAIPAEPTPSAVPAAAEKPAMFEGFWKTLANKMGAGALEGAAGLSRMAAGDLSYVSPEGFSDSLFKAIDDTFNPALESLQKSQAEREQTGKVGTGAKLAGAAAEMITPIIAGPEALLASSTMNTATGSIDQNQDIKTAYKLASVSLLANAVGMKIPMGSKLLTRVISGGAGNVAVSAASEYLTKEVLDSDGYKEAASKVDPTDPSSIVSSGLLGAVFGVLAKPHVQKKYTKLGGTLPEGPTPGVEGQEPPPPGPAPSAQPVAAVPDTPTAEPIQDLKAQVADLHDPATARQAVYLAPDNIEALGAEGLSDLAKGSTQIRNFDQKGGVLLVRDAQAAKEARALRASNPDMQAVLGRLTGAGEGKSPEQTAVVQGHTPEGAVATESAVTPEEVPGKVQEVAAEGKTPVVTTPEAAVARREASMGPSVETLEGDPEHTHAIVVGGEPWMRFKNEDAAMRRMDELMASTHTDIHGTRAEDVAGKLGGPRENLHERTHPEGTKGIVKNERMEQAAEVAGPVKDGRLPVRLFNGEGEAGEVTHVAAEDFKAGEKPAARTPPANARSMAEMTKKPANEREVSLDLSVPTKAAKEPVAGGTPQSTKPAKVQVTEPAEKIALVKVPTPSEARPVLDQLRDAQELFKGQETPPQGKRFPASVKDRAGNVAAFGRTLKTAAKLAADRRLASPERIQAALDAAAKVERLDLKSDEAIAKNQGVGHPHLAEQAARLQDAAEGLLNQNHTPAKIESAKATQLRERGQNKATRAAAEWKAHLGEHFEPGNIVKGYGGFDRVVEAPKYDKDGGWSVKVQEVKKDASGKWQEIGPVREHSTAPKKGDVIERAAKEKTAIRDVPDARKPKEITRGEQLKLRAAGKSYIESPHSELESRRAAVEHLIHEIVGDRMSADDKAMFLYNLEAERRDRARPKTRDEEIDEEFQDHRWEKPENASLEFRDRSATYTADRLWGKAESALDQNGFLEHADRLKESNQPASLHKLVDFAVQHMAPGPARAIAQHIRKFVGDVPVHFVDQIVDSRTGETLPKTGGLYTFNGLKSAEHIQVNLTARNHPLRTLLHEAVHAATYRFMKVNPDSPFTVEMKKLHQIAVARFARMHAEYEQQTGAGLERHYGLTNHDEFVAEALTSHKFQDFLIRSEAYASPSEKIRNLLSKIGDAIRGLFGIKDGPEAKLFNSVLDISGRIMDAQHKWLNPEADMMPGLDAALSLPDHPMVKAIETLRSLDDDEPRMLPNEHKIRGIVGNAAADTTRDFYRAARSGSIRSLRQLVLANSTHDQMLRTNAHWFGADDHTNPVRQYTEAEADRTRIQSQMMAKAGEIVQARGKLSRAEDRRLGQLQIDSTVWGIDPRKAADQQTAQARKEAKFDQRHADFTARWGNLSKDAQEIYSAEHAHNEWSARQNRKAAIDVALDTYSDKDVTQAQRVLLYSARNAGEFESLIGSGKLIDVGDRNPDLIASLQNTAGLRQQEGPYFHLGRHGSLVVQAHPNGMKEFPTEAAANTFAERVRDLSPNSKAKVDFLGGKWTVDYQAEYTSMHENPAQAEAQAAELRASGLDVGPVTEKVLSEHTAPLAGGVQNLIAEATRRIERRGAGQDTEALVHALKTSFVQMLASRSAYAASKLARKGVAGVKAEEMGRNFANHAQSVAWNTGHLATVFKTGEALGRVREASKNPEGVSQTVAYKRGAFMAELGKRMQQEVAQYGTRTWGNNVIAKLGFLNFLASPSHAAIWMTQNFTTAIPVGGARWGYGKAVPAFAKAMRVVSGPAFRSSFLAHVRPGTFDAHNILESVVEAVRADKTLGHWAKGDNSHLKQLLDRGMVQSSFANELSTMSRGDHRAVTRVFDYARLLPHMADVFNRVSTGLAGLEMTGGDLAKTLDFVRETHMDYGQGNKSRVFKAFNKVPGFNSVTMFRTYTQGMAHLLYSNIKNMRYAESKSRLEAAKTVAGMVLGTSLFAGVLKGAVLEPLRLAVYAYNKIFGDDDEHQDLDNSIRRFVADHTGNPAATQAIVGGLPRLLGFDMSSRMGLADLFLHDPPDLLSGDKDKITEFAASLLGPMPQMVADNYTQARDAYERGDIFDSMMALTPVKQLHDARKAFDLYTTGKQSSAGGQLTEPSAGDAFTQLIGFKPASVADSQERLSAGYGYRQFEGDRKDQLLKEFAEAPSDDRGDIMDKIQKFNAANPGMRISYSDFLKQRRAAQRAAAMSEGGQTRDPGVDERTNY